MMELIERLEKLTGPDREVDAEIAVVLGWTQHHVDVAPEHSHWIAPDRTRWVLLPQWTASLDAAVSLFDHVPEMVPSDPIEACIMALLKCARSS